jgi:hypothetical protein
MPESVSVLVPTRNPNSSTFSLINSLDVQSLPYDRFETVYADWGSTDGTLQRLRRLAASRPNVKLTGGPGNATDDELIMVALAEATGDYVLVVQPAHRLLPQALERMVQFAEEHQAEVVVGRTIRNGASDLALVPANRPRILGDDLAPSLAAGAVLVRRTLLLDVDRLPGQRGFADQILARTDAVAGYADYPVLLGAEAERTEVPPGGHPTVQWVDAKLHLQLTVEREAGEPAEDAQIVVALQHSVTGEEFAIPVALSFQTGDESSAEASPPDTSGSTGGSRGHGCWSLDALIDPEQAALGQTLPDGLWQIVVRIAIAGRERAITVAQSEVPPALLDGRGFVVTSSDGRMVLDVGAVQHGLVARASADDAQVTESVAGSLLKLMVPGLYVEGTGTYPGHLLIGSLPLPATLVSDGEQVFVECYVSGLPGSAALSVQFGGAKPIPTGLSLDISAVGAMKVVKTPAAPAKPASKPAPKAASKQAGGRQPSPKKTGTTPSGAVAGAARPAAKKPSGPQPVVKRLRASVPSPLEPVVRRIARLAPARWAYRKLTH